MTSHPAIVVEQRKRAEALNGRGAELVRQGKLVEAAAHFRQAVQLWPGHARGHHNLGVVLSRLNDVEGAVASLRQALDCQPGYAEAHCNLGSILAEMGRHEEAVASFREAVRLRPDYADALNNLGLALTCLRRPGEAVVVLRQVLRLCPDFAEGHNNLGLALAACGEFAEAEASYERVLRLDPRHVDAHINLGSLYRDKGQLDRAVASYDLALALSPGSASAHCNRALAWLQAGNFEQGWHEYEWRFRRDGGRKSLGRPEWDGSDLEGRAILLRMEQGLGDMIQFIRYAPIVKGCGGRVVVACAAPLMGLLARCSGIDQLIPEKSVPPEFDVHAPLMSLPGLLGTALATVPAEVPYLFADPGLVERWRERLSGLKGLRVGVAWQGNPRHPGDAHRSFPLARLKALADVNGVCQLSLQKGPGTEQVGRFPLLNLGPELDAAGPFMDTAAVMKNLDLIISADTAVAHLAGALGVPVWLALSAVADWRWLMEREDSPWYPTMRLFRQARLGEWGPVFERMAGELRRRSADQSQGRC